MAGPILSSVLCCLFGVAILTHTVFLLFPSASRNPQVTRKDRSRIVRLFGPLIGVRDVDAFGGLLVLCIFAPIVVFVWAPADNAKLALTACICLATAQPALCLFGFYSTFLRLLPGLRSPTFVILSVIFGFVGLLWRLLDRSSSGLEGRNLPLVVYWHGLWSSIMALYVLQMKSRIPSLKSSIKLESQREEALKNDPKVTWPAGCDGPLGFVPHPVELEAMSNIEQADARQTPKLQLAACILLLILSVVLGADSEKGQELHERHGHRLVLCASLPILVLWNVALSATVIAYEPFGFGQTARDREPLVSSGTSRTTYT